MRLCSQTDLLSPSILENHFAILWRRTVWIPDSDSFSFWVPKAFLPPPQPSTDQFASRSFVANIIFRLHWSEISQAIWSQLQLSAWHTRREGTYRRDCSPPPRHQIGLWANLWRIFLIVNPYGEEGQPTVGGIIPRQPSLGCISNQRSSMFSALSSRLGFPTWWTSTCKPK